ncbi:uncharacterized protein LOC130743546 [Lotus japonicus]|uniref:uncharacterized protein LOC130743546 n=1 Tax=Lotus japonicus TaxID=34305 RepID=UPI0025834A71|nr:uncharacterized protein LOC130743546 [Lotus japonicus]
MESFKVLVLCSLLLHFIPSINTLDTIVPGQSVKEDKTLVSADGSFEAGFFNFGDPNQQYFGIWYKDISPRTVVWIANRDSPLGNSSGVLNVTDGGNLVILDATNVLVWSSNTSTTAKKPVVQLLESGNLVVREESNPENLLWQSFDHPGDTLLAGMKIRSNLKNGKYTSLVSWKDTQNPATGEYSYRIDTRGYPQLVITKENNISFRIGSWNGNTYSGIPSKTMYRLLNFSFVITDQEVVYGYELLNKSTITRLILTTSGQAARYILSDQTKSWQFLFAGPSDQCDNYAFCGANSNCDANVTPLCECLPGFVPKSQEDWNSQRWYDGCVRQVNLDCVPNNGFLKYTGMKLPDTSASWFDKSMKLEECEKFCLKKCSCSAYASLDIRDGGSGCLLWFNNVIDLRKLTSGGQDLYIRVAASELGHNKGLNKEQLAGVLAGCIMFIVAMIILGMVLLWRKRTKKLQNPGKKQIFRWNNHPHNKENEDIDIPIFDLSTIANATDNFSICNKLGEGGFGPVYKGTLTNGQNIAVKRLCNNTGQGPQEFINEVFLIANLQHRNLVKLLGCCIQNDERILIYEFMINRSLDYFIFDQTGQILLLWDQRFKIISGISRGLLYLHEDSRLRIIHRDLKASNILLDENMNPKISDFGLARIFGGDEAEDKTKRVAGTYGYMSPEYAAHGYFSVKSDVFSFGVILLEIVSGKNNREYFPNDLQLIGHAWKLWCKNTPLEVLDESLGDSIAPAIQEVSRCIHTGLLCVQERPEDRPDMSAVVLMLNGEKPLPRPKEPAFYPRHLSSPSANSKRHSTNEISLSLLDTEYRKQWMESFIVLVLCSLLLHFIPSFYTLDIVAPGQSLKDDKTLVSAEGSFEAGFFNFGDPNSQYFGIWYKGLSPRTVAWIANRDSPVGNSSGVLNITDGGNLVILDATKGLVWSSNISTTAKKPVLQLLETGNLVVREESNPENLLWQSFDLPGDTFLPEMKIRSNIKIGNYTSLVCWKDTENPARGEYSYRIDTRGYPQVVITQGETLLFRVGSWNGKILTGIPSETLYKLFDFSFVITDEEVSYGYQQMNQSIISRYMLTSIGQVQRLVWSDQTKSWQLFFVGPADQCDNYALCGANSNCDVDNSPTCECLQGFIPKSQGDWNSQKWNDGCVRRVNLDCGLSDGFLKHTGMKLPDTSASWLNKSMNLEECEKFCLKNCSCTAYASLDVRDGGSGCLLWFNNIMDVRIMTSGGQDLYIRVADSELDHHTGLNKMQLAGVLAGCSVFVGAMIILGVALLWKKKLKKTGKSQILRWKSHPDNKEDESIDIPIFELSTIAKATNNFSTSNKLGEGGFGPVYKGTWTNGQDIAVKRLCDNSGQGPKEFINEVVLIANLQHRNLVKLLGCCIQNDERILIYEFMINRSLDYFIFDQTRKSSLLWAQRFKIICGIAKGLLYLHEDSRLRIIHRDLKASNILLDENMNPKISDFGLARIFGGDEVGEKTKSVAGTYGYISPEYAARGYFSVKSDVFSYGVILLEIVSGKKNTGYFDHHDLHLLGHAWRLWCEQMLLELIDESLGDSIALAEQEVLRCIQTGLLCVQDRPEDRPDMSAVVLMLNGEKPLPRPKEPAFYPRHLGSSSENSKLHSTNEMSMSLLKPR